MKLKYSKNKMYLEALLVCVKYADYFTYFLDYNQKYFDDLLVVTMENDEQTIELCKKRDVRYTFTNRLGPQFNKGKAINDGFAKLSLRDWILITDADMIFPDNFRKRLETEKLNKDFLYGACRCNFRTFKEWNNYLALDTAGRDALIADRNEQWREWKSRRKKIVGYFQLFNIQSFGFDRNKVKYSEDSPTANVSDRYFYLLWEKKHRRMINSFDLIHFAHRTGADGKNWRGRVGNDFGLK